MFRKLCLGLLVAIACTGCNVDWSKFKGGGGADQPPPPSPVVPEPAPTPEPLPPVPQPVDDGVVTDTSRAYLAAVATEVETGILTSSDDMVQTIQRLAASGYIDQAALNAFGRVFPEFPKTARTLTKEDGVRLRSI